jgi:hypothetical protein
MEKMTMTRRWGWIGMVGAGLVLSAATGCQTWTSGMTLPSGRYLEHPPQYIPEGPQFPLTRELARMEEAQPIGVGFGAAPVPPAVPPAVPPGGFR